VVDDDFEAELRTTVQQRSSVIVRVCALILQIAPRLLLLLH
jgi:hypothetical protein